MFKFKTSTTVPILKIRPVIASQVPPFFRGQDRLPWGGLFKRGAQISSDLSSDLFRSPQKPSGLPSGFLSFPQIPSDSLRSPQIPSDLPSGFLSFPHICSQIPSDSLRFPQIPSDSLRFALRFPQFSTYSLKLHATSQFWHAVSQFWHAIH